MANGHGGARSKAKLSWAKEDYDIINLKGGQHSFAEKVREYTKLRATANRRLERFETAKDEHIREAEIYKQYKNAFKPATSLKEADIDYALQDVSRFISSPLSSVRGQQQYVNKQIEAMHLNGYTFVNKSNYWDFTEFLTEMHDRYQGRKIPDSDRIAELYQETRRLGVKSSELVRDLDFWINNKDLLETISADEVKGLSSAKIKDYVKNKKK